ncbi:MAG: two-component system regulatory protein YycI [Thermosediminibacteraceae bacterium]|nr:two-component system regulatory protein YycI [Thermosediminibacteraceae bacterium]
MDWRKAIGILIVSFLVLNILLAVNLYIETLPQKDFSLEEGQQQEIKTFLESRGIILETQIPLSGRPVPFLEISYQPQEAEKILKQFFGEEKPKIEEIRNGKKYRVGKRELIIMDNGTINFTVREDKESLASLDEHKALQVAEEFIKNHVGFPKDARLNTIKYDSESKGYLVEYVRYYQGFFIANSFMELLVTPDGVRNFYMSWLKPLKFKGKKREVIPPIAAILRVEAEKNSGEQVVIKKVEQGYYSQFYNADRWLAAPVWKVELKNGEVYYINAYTGELEQ